MHVPFFERRRPCPRAPSAEAHKMFETLQPLLRFSSFQAEQAVHNCTLYGVTWL